MGLARERLNASPTLVSRGFAESPIYGGIRMQRTIEGLYITSFPEIRRGFAFRANQGSVQSFLPSLLRGGPGFGEVVKDFSLV